MGLFSKMKENGDNEKNEHNKPSGGQSFPEKMAFSFEDIPSNLEEMLKMPEISMDSPYKTAALAICALCAYSQDKESGLAMLDYLRGPRPLSNAEKSFLKDRFMDNGKYIPFSYFSGANPQNDYMPQPPYTLDFFSDRYSFSQPGYAKLSIRSGGADSSRQITMRSKDGKWYLWDQAVMVGIRAPKSSDPWL